MGYLEVQNHEDELHLEENKRRWFFEQGVWNAGKWPGNEICIHIYLNCISTRLQGP